MPCKSRFSFWINPFLSVMLFFSCHILLEEATVLNAVDLLVKRCIEDQ